MSERKRFLWCILAAGIGAATPGCMAIKAVTLPVKAVALPFKTAKALSVPIKGVAKIVGNNKDKPKEEPEKPERP